MHYKKVDRIPFYEILHFWGPTINRWYSEGLPVGMQIYDYLDFDNIEYIPINFGPIPAFVNRTLEETERYIVQVGSNGVVSRSLKTDWALPTFLDWPVKKREDWQKMKNRFDSYDKRRYPLSWGEELFDYYHTVDHPIWLQIPGFFAESRDLLGLKNLLIAFYKKPDLIHDIMDYWVNFVIEASKDALIKAKIDFVVIWEDMAYKNGPHISPRLFKDFILPNYKKVTNFVRKCGVDIIMVDTDGNHEVLTPLFIEGGVNCVYPLEVAAEMDANILRRKYGKKLGLIGNIDKRALAVGKKAIDMEVERITPLIEDGGYIPSIDHAVPPDVPFKNYLYYYNLIKSRFNIS
jgi:uroporphyrinogen decarboxylase